MTGSVTASSILYGHTGSRHSQQICRKEEVTIQVVSIKDFLSLKGVPFLRLDFEILSGKQSGYQGSSLLPITPNTGLFKKFYQLVFNHDPAGAKTILVKEIEDKIQGKQFEAIVSPDANKGTLDIIRYIDFEG